MVAHLLASAWWFGRSPDNDSGGRPFRARERKSVERVVTPVTDADSVFLERIRRGEARAFETMFHKYYVPLVRAAFGYIHSRELAEEIVQDVFLRIWERRTRLDIQDTFAVYLYGAVRFESFKRSRRQAIERRGQVHVAIAMEPRDASDNPAILPGEQDDLDLAIQQTIAEMPERCREVFQLYREHQLNSSEIGRILGIAPATVRVQLGRAMRLLRERLIRFR